LENLKARNHLFYIGNSYRYEDDIKVDTDEIGYEGVSWIDVAQDGD
jgi:hypothetical protein